MAFYHNSPRTSLRTTLALLAVMALAAGCSGSRTVRYDEVEIVRAETEVAPAELLDVGILIFDPGVAEDTVEVKDFIFPDVRRAEARYMPYHLKRTLESTSLWGSVWVLPDRSEMVDVLVWARVDHSNGYDVKLQVGAWDATGKQWLNKSYKTKIPEKAYSKYRDKTQDPYQSVYNEIANDLLDVRRSMSEKELQNVRNLAELRYAADLVPVAFSTYLDESNGTYRVRRLPADDDPMVARLQAVREREYTLVDTLNEYYAGLYYELSPPYENWRKMSREETLNYKELKRSARMRQLMGLAAILGAVAYEASGGSNSAITVAGASIGSQVLVAGFEKSSEANMRAETIKELGESFDAEAEPLLVEVEGQTRRLTGTAEEKYREWRKLLREIYSSETGIELQDGEAPDLPQAANDE